MMGENRHGSIGAAVNLKANHFAVQLISSPEVQIQEYKAKFFPEADEEDRISRVDIWEQVKKFPKLRGAFFDGVDRVFLIGQRREEEELKCASTFQIFGCSLALTVNFEHLGEVSSTEYFKVFDIILRDKLRSRFLVMGSFLGTDRDKDVGQGIERWTGFGQTIGPTESGPSLVIDIEDKEFFARKLLSIIEELNHDTDIVFPLSDSHIDKVKKALKKVAAVHASRFGRLLITDLIHSPEQDTSLALSVIHDNDVTIKASDYFTLKCSFEPSTFTSLPVVHVETPPYYAPIEACSIIDEHSHPMLYDEQTISRDNHRISDQINEMLKFVSLKVERSLFEIANKFTSVNGRVLPPPEMFIRGVKVEPSKGRWDIKKLNKGIEVHGGLSIINFSTLDQTKITYFCDDFIRVCLDLGMVLPATPSYIHCGLHDDISGEHLINNVLLSLKGENMPECIIIVLPETSEHYGLINELCDKRLGCMTQCFHPNEVAECKHKHLMSAALNMNAKLGGQHTFVKMDALHSSSKGPTVVFGFACSYPLRISTTNCFTSAMVASIDWPLLSQYTATFSAQKCGTMTTDPRIFTVMFRTLIDDLVKSNIHPSEIVFYRDGLWEGQNSDIFKSEVQIIKEVCAKKISTNVRITYVVAERKHKTRVFNESYEPNIGPGTVIDSKICCATGLNFFLCSNYLDMGKPTHYFLVDDEHNIQANDIQSFTYNLCYTYVCRSESVSIVPPILYARKAAKRAHGFLVEAAAMPSMLECHGNLKSKMFYC